MKTKKVKKTATKKSTSALRDKLESKLKTEVKPDISVVLIFFSIVLIVLVIFLATQVFFMSNRQRRLNDDVTPAFSRRINPNYDDSVNSYDPDSTKKKDDKAINSFENNVTEKTSNEKVLLESVNSISEIQSVDGFWNRYQNYQLGFSLKIPKKDSDGNPLQIIEEDEVVFIVPYKDRLENIKEAKNIHNKFEKVQGIPFGIIIEKVENDKDLNDFIKKRYGAKCQLETNQKALDNLYTEQSLNIYYGEKMQSSVDLNHNKIFDVFVKPNVSDYSRDDGEDCILNFAFVIKYSPLLKKVVAWDIGQDCNFYNKQESHIECLDKVIADSFEFMEK